MTHTEQAVTEERLTREEVGFLIKEMIKLSLQEQSPGDSPYINRRIGEIFETLFDHLGYRAMNA